MKRNIESSKYQSEDKTTSRKHLTDSFCSPVHRFYFNVSTTAVVSITFTCQEGPTRLIPQNHGKLLQLVCLSHLSKRLSSCVHWLNTMWQSLPLYINTLHQHHFTPISHLLKGASRAKDGKKPRMPNTALNKCNKHKDRLKE